MIFDQFYLSCLAHASYLIGSDGVGAVVDPQRDVEIYLDAARERGLHIRYVIETHLHADFVSGHRELAELTGATIYLGDGSGAEFPHVSVRDGDEVTVGQCRLRFLQTPGHTPESICIVIHDPEHGDEPCGVLTGDTLFIGDVGRPDLSATHTAQELAGLLYDSLHEKVLTLPDSTLVYPAHGAGSMCGRNISTDRSSTIGRERRSNYALRPMTRDQFVELMTNDLPVRPEYFAKDVELNRQGAEALIALAPIVPYSAEGAEEHARQGGTILDTRSASDFCAAHIPGSINIGLSGQFASWAGSVIGLDRRILLVAEDLHSAEQARLRLARVGIEHVTGYLRGGINEWMQSGRALEAVPQMTVFDVRAALESKDDLVVLDVRRKGERTDGYIAGSIHEPLDTLGQHLDGYQIDRPMAVHCKGGYRSAIAASLLQAHGFKHVANVTGGIDAWNAAQLPLMR